jgi:hypothetical protein
MQEKHKRRPIIDPLLLILKSRRVLIALASLIVALLIMGIPQLEAVSKELLVLVITLALALIAGYSVEDAVTVARQSPLPMSIHEQIREVLYTLLDEAALQSEKDLWRTSSEVKSTGPDGSPS